MHTLSTIIHTLSDEEKRSFVSLLRQKNKRSDTKNIELFKLLSSTTEHKDLDIKIYGKRAKGAYHALCKRLYDSLIDFIASKSFDKETSEEIETIKLLMVSRIFFEQKQYKIAFKTITKAAQKAKAYALFSILNEIYYTQIQYAHLKPEAPLDELLFLFKSNKAALQQEENLNLFYATIQHELLQQKQDIVFVIKDSLSRFGISITRDLTFRSLFKILEITNKTASITREYHSILPFVEEVYNLIDAEEALRDKHVFYHIQILYYVANSYFRNKNFVASQHYLNVMKKHMEANRHKYYKRFLPQHTLVQSLIYNYTGHAKKAIEMLEDFEYDKYKDQLTYLLDLKLGLIVYYFQQSRFKEALHLLHDFYHSDQWYTEKADISWVIKKNLIEILVYIELDHIDLVESRVNSFRKKHGSYLKINNEIRALEFLKLTLMYYRNPDIATTEQFKDKIQTSLTTTAHEHEDLFDMSFYAWLKSKTDNTDLYQTTLHLIEYSVSQ